MLLLLYAGQIISFCLDYFLVKCTAVSYPSVYFLSDNDVDGETVDCGLTETMVSYLFQGSFKKQVKFNQFVCKLKEPVVTLTLEPVPPEECQQSSSAIPRLVNV